MSTSYHRQRQALMEGGPVWMLVMIVLLVALCLIGLPAIVLGYLGQRGVSRWITSWRVRFFFWFFLGTISVVLLFLHADVLKALITKELTDYVITLKNHRMDFGHWAIKMLWAETCLVWLQTLVAIPIMAFWQELGANTHVDTVNALKQEQRRCQRQSIHAQKHAMRRTHRPQRLPDALGNEMVIGVPIHRREED